MARPTACTISTWLLRGFMNNTASSAGTSMPSDRQRAFERMRHPPLEEPFNHSIRALPVQSMMLSVHMLCLATECPRSLLFRQLFDGLLNDAVPVCHQTLRGPDRVGESDRATQSVDRPFAWALVLRVLQRPPTPDDLRRIGQVDLTVAGREMRLQGPIHVPF